MVEEFVTYTAITNAKLTLLDDKGAVVKRLYQTKETNRKMVALRL